jgi:hypothetical protein
MVSLGWNQYPGRAPNLPVTVRALESREAPPETSNVKGKDQLLSVSHI